jgi:hypothetical protein
MIPLKVCSTEFLPFTILRDSSSPLLSHGPSQLCFQWPCYPCRSSALIHRCRESIALTKRGPFSASCAVTCSWIQSSRCRTRRYCASAARQSRTSLSLIPPPCRHFLTPTTAGYSLCHLIWHRRCWGRLYGLQPIQSSSRTRPFRFSREAPSNPHSCVRTARRARCLHHQRDLLEPNLPRRRSIGRSSRVIRPESVLQPAGHAASPG